MTERVAVVAPEPEAPAEAVREAGGEPFGVRIPEYPAGWGVALVREWVADRLEIELGALAPDALVFEGGSPAEVAGVLAAGVRLDLPAAHAGSTDAATTSVFDAAVAALGFAPFSAEKERLTAAVGAALGAVGEKGLSAKRLVDSFSLANALRVGVSLGAGPETLVHLAALGREAEVVGFPRMMRVLTPETPAVTHPGSGWYRSVGFGGLLGHLEGSLHDARTVAGPLKSFATDPEAEPPAEEAYTCEFVRARASGAEVLCRVPAVVDEVSGICRVFSSEAVAVAAVEDLDGEPEEAVFLVVRGSGAGGGPGLMVLGELGEAIRDLGLSGRVSVLTDGLAPEATVGSWASAFTPEAVSGGVIGRLADGDLFRVDLAEDRMLTSVTAEEISGRRGFRRPARRDRGLAAYAQRYAKSSLPAFEGATFA